LPLENVLEAIADTTSASVSTGRGRPLKGVIPPFR
jgi:hypothetical protein